MAEKYCESTRVQIAEGFSAVRKIHHGARGNLSSFSKSGINFAESRLPTSFFMTASRRLLKELSDVAKSPIPGISVQTVGDNVMHWDVTLTGPAGTPYEGGLFHVEVKMPPEYPMKAPDVRFTTKIYHPNISADGRACIKVVNEWAPSVMMTRVLKEIMNVLENPDGSHADNAEIGLKFMEHRAEFDAEARKWTAQYAK